MAAFQYKPLQHPDSFRLILLEPSPTSHSPLRCTLEYATISHCSREIIDHYTALSYVWGNPSAKKASIFIDDYEVGIGASLEAALRDLRDENRVLRIWADALCIDQSNLVERGSQVELMGQIYSTAHHTVIYLGSLDIAQQVLDAVPSYTTGAVVPWDLNELRSLAERGLLGMPWFTRVWIFQELLLSADPWVQVGRVRARWNQLCWFLLSQGFKQRSKVLQVLGDMNSAISVHKANIFVYLKARRGLGATDPRDMIFAHIGIAVDAEELGRYVKVDYRSTCGKVYNDTAKYLLEAFGPETLFHHARDCEGESKVEGLVSWAPEWSSPSAGLSEMYRNNTLSTQRLNAKKNYFVLEFEGAPVLAYLGYEVDRISAVSLILPKPESLRTGREMYEKAVNSLTTFYRTAGSGVWWSGDEDGQHRNFDFRGKEDEHRQLTRTLHHEWLDVLGEYPPQLIPRTSKEEIQLHERFMESFKAWVTAREERNIIMTGQDSEGIESLMWAYLLHTQNSSEIDDLTGRRFATTRAGSVAIVSKQTQEGDRIIYLAGSPVAYIVRIIEHGSDEYKYKVEQEIKMSIVSDTTGNGSKDNAIRNNLQILLRRCVLIGECYIEGVVGWTRGKQANTIYALS